MSQPLSAQAEALRLEIKELITKAGPKGDLSDETDATIFTQDQYGYKSYLGGELAKKVALLVKEMPIELV
ncbi:hypothetical protein N7540_010997 [Penicillium herquei]|nr:hypothetical protein N7540_010997 [Penicillium herquei]